VHEKKKKWKREREAVHEKKKKWKKSGEEMRGEDKKRNLYSHVLAHEWRGFVQSLHAEVVTRSSSNSL